METEIISTEMRRQSYIVCRDYLQGAWKSITQSEMIVKHISGGLSNHLYYCALPSTVKPCCNEPSEVLVRVYGQVHGEGALESLMGESVIFALLSERRLGPKLYGVFPGGRIEQYIPARSLSTEELADPVISNQIAIKLAKLHSLHVPISKEPSWIWDCLERWQKSSDEFLRRASTDSGSSTFSTSSSSQVTKSDVIDQLRANNYEEEVAFVRRIVNHVQSPVVFSHNDLQEGNILIKENYTGPIKDRLSLIDFEYCSYNYRGFDMANHFCEWMYNYKFPKHPFFAVDKTAFPSKTKQLRFIRVYLSENERKSNLDTKLGAKVSKSPLAECFSGNLSNNESKDQEVVDENVSPETNPTEEKILQEIRVFEAVSHLMWGLWSIVQAHVSKIPFGYLEYAAIRLDHYFYCKKGLKGSDVGKRQLKQRSPEP